MSNIHIRVDCLFTPEKLAYGVTNVELWKNSVTIFQPGSNSSSIVIVFLDETEGMDVFFEAMVVIKVGKTLFQFLIEMRIKAACRLLMENKYTVKQICFEVGFQNFSSFHKYFKNITGTTPLGYQHLKH